jgi:hypothetical protein
MERRKNKRKGVCFENWNTHQSRHSLFQKHSQTVEEKHARKEIGLCMSAIVRLGVCIYDSGGLVFQKPKPSEYLGFF